MIQTLLFLNGLKDGELNLSYNCLDRHLETDSDRVAFYWEGEPGDTQEITVSYTHLTLPTILSV